MAICDWKFIVTECLFFPKVSTFGLVMYRLAQYNMKIYIVIVTYNGEQWLDKCFDSLRQLDVPVKTIVVDNGSTDGTIGSLRSRFPEVDIIQPGKNLGFGMGNDVGVKKAIAEGADFIFLFNQDAYILSGSFAALIDAFALDKQAGIISPIHLAGDERNLDFGFYKYLNPEATPFLLGDFFNHGLKPLYQSKFVNAAAWVMKTSMIKDIGFFHPAFDHYGEDMEYTSRMAKHGYKTFVFPAFCIVHDRPQNRSTNKYHQYGQDFQRRMLQALIEKTLTYKQVTVRFFKMFLFNLLTLRPSRAAMVYKNWRKLNERKRFI